MIDVIRASLLPSLFAAVAVSAAAQQAPKPDEEALDGTSSDACPLVVAPVRFCGTGPAFTLTPQTDNPDVTAYYATPEGIQALMIIEPLGTADGLTVPDMQASALQILSGATGQPAESQPILGRSTIPVMGIPSPNFIYRGVVGGIPIVYSNTMVLREHTVSQFITLETGVTTYSPRHQDLHTRFLGQI